MEVIGRIVGIGEGTAAVEVGPGDPCSAGGCNGCRGRKVVDVRIRESRRIGDRVRLRSREGMHRALTWTAFLAAFCAVLAAAVELDPAAGREGHEGRIAVAFALVAGLAGWLAARWWTARRPAYTLKGSR
jgi:hypothetical protein